MKSGKGRKLKAEREAESQNGDKKNGKGDKSQETENAKKNLAAKIQSQFAILMHELIDRVQQYAYHLQYVHRQAQEDLVFGQGGANPKSGENLFDVLAFFREVGLRGMLELVER